MEKPKRRSKKIVYNFNWEPPRNDFYKCESQFNRAPSPAQRLKSMKLMRGHERWFTPKRLGDYLSKFEEKTWCLSHFNGLSFQTRSAAGHCGEIGRKTTKWSRWLRFVFKRHGMDLDEVNDGFGPYYERFGQTPRTRILAALSLMWQKDQEADYYQEYILNPDEPDYTPADLPDSIRGSGTKQDSGANRDGGGLEEVLREGAASRPSNLPDFVSREYSTPFNEWIKQRQIINRAIKQESGEDSVREDGPTDPRVGIPNVEGS